ncbi:AAA family ATPase [Halobaculum sp. MBLA0147]|uniref:AAA family ATPase n=1 Tax=Halobaculum sp. MBLA0147 TaxID=3079934 RepID=UPI0035266271
MSYDTSQAHLDDELDRLHTALTAFDEYDPVSGNSDSEPTPSGEYAHSDAFGERHSLAPPPGAREDVRRDLAEIRTHLRETSDDVRLRVRVLADRFGLSRPHLDVFLLALAPELDDDFGRLLRSIQGETKSPAPTVGSIEDFFGTFPGRSHAAVTLIASGSPLRRYDLVSLGESSAPADPERRRPITVPERIVTYVKGDETLDSDLAEVAALTTPDTTREDLRLDDTTHERLQTVAESPREDGHVYYFYGAAGSEKRRAVDALVDDDRLLRADLEALLEDDRLDRFRREALLQDCPVHLKNVSEATADPGENIAADLPDREHPPTVGEVLDALAPLERDLYLTATDAWTPTSGRDDTSYSLLQFPDPSFDLREQIWEGYADELADDVDPTTLASTFELTQGQIDDAVTTARALADDPAEPIPLETIREGCTAQSAEGLEDLAEKIDPEATWDEVVLTDDTEAELQEVAARVRHRGTVYEQWGFEERFSRGTGVVALFAGPSGTGKTLSAEVIAADAGMDLYKIDLSSVVSKYIGETEENLERIFDAARDSNAILLFDEADAVFGQRAGVSDATDRYANVEVNYLLQRIESYDGVVLLTTNNESQMDDAFVRRIHQTVQFERPQERQRESIWHVMFPEDTPTENIDYAFLSQFDMPGGNIRNVAQTAAVLAADDDGVVRMKHVVRATERELNKIGKLYKIADFGEYSEYLRASSGEATETATATTTTQRDTPQATAQSNGHRETTAPDERRSDTGAEQPTDESGTAPSADHTERTQSPEPTQTANTGENGSAPGTAETGPPNKDALAAAEEARGATEPSLADDTPESIGVDSGATEQGTDADSLEAGELGEEMPEPDLEETGTRDRPEVVVKQFFQYLSEGDGEAAHALYHTEGYVEQFSDREIAMLREKDLVVKDFERLTDTKRRVTLRFVQELGERELPLEYELRPQDREWRIFDLRQPGR